MAKEGRKEELAKALMVMPKSFCALLISCSRLCLKPRKNQQRPDRGQSGKN
jgi:hypothetical protein